MLVGLSSEQILLNTFKLVKRQGAQEAVDDCRKLRKRYEELKRSTDNRLIEVQDLLRRVQDYERALGSFGDWLREEKGTVNLIESFACTTEGINAEIAKLKVVFYV